MSLDQQFQCFNFRQIKSRDVCKLLSFVLTRIKTDEHVSMHANGASKFVEFIVFNE